jgi:hypothetical protein
VLSARTAALRLGAVRARLQENADGTIRLRLGRSVLRYLEQHPGVRGTIKVTYLSGTDGIVRERVRFVTR